MTMPIPPDIMKNLIDSPKALMIYFIMNGVNFKKYRVRVMLSIRPLNNNNDRIGYYLISRKDRSGLWIQNDIHIFTDVYRYLKIDYSKRKKIREKLEKITT